MENIRDNKGVSLIELLIVLTIVGVIAGFGLPEYGRFAAKSRVRAAATDMIQSMRMARTMSIKENRTYITRIGIAANLYRIGFDTTGNGLLTDATDVYGQGPVRQVNIANTYGSNVVIGVANLNFVPPNGPNGTAIAPATTISFLSDSSSNPNTMIYFQDTQRGYSFAVELANTAGKTNLFMWQGDEDNTGATGWLELR